MRPVKKYDKQYLKEKIKISNSFRDFGKRIGIDGKTAKSVALRYNIDCSHFPYSKTCEKMIGQKYNKLTVLSISRIKEKGKRVKVFANCQCDCGNKKRIFASSIKRGSSGSCGCDKSRYIKTSGKNSVLYKGYEEISGKRWGNIKEGARQRNLTFNITLQYAWDLFEKQNKKCSLSGVPLYFGRANHKQSEATASIDRIDSSKGYIEGNIQWVHKSINIMKNALSNDIFISFCHEVSKKHKSTIDIKKLSQNHFS